MAYTSPPAISKIFNELIAGWLREELSDMGMAPKVVGGYEGSATKPGGSAIAPGQGEATG